MIYETLRAQQLIACAHWNFTEANRAASAKGVDKEEREYLARRAARLSAQATSLYQQADDYEWDAIMTHPSNYACDDQPAQ